jgi:hypothetical protein
MDVIQTELGKRPAVVGVEQAAGIGELPNQAEHTPLRKQRLGLNEIAGGRVCQLDVLAADRGGRQVDHLIVTNDDTCIPPRQEVFDIPTEGRRCASRTLFCRPVT